MNKRTMGITRDPQADVLANVFSCRQQIRCFGDNRARHLAEILYRHLDTANLPGVRS